jgi:hypothetical protein
MKTIKTFKQEINMKSIARVVRDPYSSVSYVVKVGRMEIARYGFKADAEAKKDEYNKAN